MNEETQETKTKIIGNYHLGRIIGKGTFAIVREGKQILTGQKVSMKIMVKDMIIDNRDRLNLSRQIRILRKVRHPNIVQLFQIMQTKLKIYMIMEYISDGELFNFITKSNKGRLDELTASKIFQQILNAVQYLHNIGITHRDIKPQNILLDQQGNAKLIDFGLSNLYQANEKLSTACGSPCYAAPEMLAQKQYDPKLADLWSCGVVLYAMLCGFLPFEDENTKVLYEKMKTERYDEPSFLSQDSKSILKKLLKVNPDERITIDQIRKQNFCKKVHFKVVRGLYPGQTIRIEDHIIKQMNFLGITAPSKDIQKHCNSINTATYYLLLNQMLKAEKKTLMSYFLEIESQAKPRKSSSLMLKRPTIQSLQGMKSRRFAKSPQQYHDELTELIQKLSSKNKQKIRKVCSNIRVRRIYS